MDCKHSSGQVLFVALLISFEVFAQPGLLRVFPRCLMTNFYSCCAFVAAFGDTVSADYTAGPCNRCPGSEGHPD